MNVVRMVSLVACLLAFASAASLTAAHGAVCVPGAEACPVVLKMKPGTTTIEAFGSVSAERPDYYFTFAARAGQKMTVQTAGGGLKTGPGIPLTGPNGFQDAVDPDMPYTLPATGAYVLTFHANTMSDGPFGRFKMTLTIK